jgi:hypothetical protein
MGVTLSYWKDNRMTLTASPDLNGPCTLQVWEMHNPLQIFEMQDTQDDGFVLLNTQTGFVLAAPNERNVVISASPGSAGSRWQVTQYDFPDMPQLSSSARRISNMTTNGNMNVAGGNTAAGTLIYIWDDNEENSILYIGPGF